MLTAAGHSPLCENQREEVEMEDTGDAGAGTRATCHVPAEWGTRVTGAGGLLGLHGANLLQITPGSATSLLGKCGCICVLGDFITETKRGTTF